MQLAYGDDGLDPLTMEGSAQGHALNLKRFASVVAARAGPPPPRMALPEELLAAACEVLQGAGARGSAAGLRVWQPLVWGARTKVTPARRPPDAAQARGEDTVKKGVNWRAAAATITRPYPLWCA